MTSELCKAGAAEDVDVTKQVNRREEDVQENCSSSSLINTLRSRCLERRNHSKIITI
jgi:hypothetical protein